MLFITNISNSDELLPKPLKKSRNIRTSIRNEWTISQPKHRLRTTSWENTTNTLDTVEWADSLKNTTYSIGHKVKEENLRTTHLLMKSNLRWQMLPKRELQVPSVARQINLPNLSENTEGSSTLWYQYQHLECGHKHKVFSKIRAIEWTYLEFQDGLAPRSGVSAGFLEGWTQPEPLIRASPSPPGHGSFMVTQGSWRSLPEPAQPPLTQTLSLLSKVNQ